MKSITLVELGSLAQDTHGSQGSIPDGVANLTFD